MSSVLTTGAVYSPACLPACLPAFLQSGQAKANSPYCSLPSLVGAVCVADAMSRVRASPTASQPASQPAYILASRTALVNTRASMLDSSSQHRQQRAEGAGGRLSTCVACPPADEWVRSIQRPVRRGHQGGALFLMASGACFDHRSRKLHPALPENAVGLHGCGTLLQSTHLKLPGRHALRLMPLPLLLMPPCRSSSASTPACRPLCRPPLAPRQMSM